MLEILSIGLLIMIIRNHVNTMERHRAEARSYGRERA